MNSARFVAAAALLLAWPALAQAEDLHVGDTVIVGSTGERGVVTEVGQKLADGGTMVRVQLERFGPPSPGGRRHVRQRHVARQPDGRLRA